MADLSQQVTDQALDAEIAQLNAQLEAGSNAAGQSVDINASTDPEHIAWRQAHGLSVNMDENGSASGSMRVKPTPTPDEIHNQFLSLFSDHPDVQENIKAAVKDVGQGIVETPAAAIGGAVKGINEAVDMIDSLGDAITQKVGGPAWTPDGGIQWVAPGEWDQTQGTGAKSDMTGGRRVINPTPEPDSMTGKFVEGVSQFLTGMAVGGRALKGAKLAGVGGAGVQAAARGAISDFAFFDGAEANLSALIQGTPLANPVSAMLAIDKDDPELVGRFKRAAEGVGLGALTDGLLRVVRAVRAAKQARPATLAAEDTEAAQAGVSMAQYREVLGDPEGEVWHSTSKAQPKGDPSAKLDAARAEMDAAGTGPKRLGEAPDRVGLNMGRINVPDDIANVITRTEDLNQDALARAVGYRSWAEADAASGGIDGYKLLMERQAGKAFTDVEALAARKTDLAAWASVQKAARAYKELPTPASAAALRETWVKAYAVHKELLGARAEAARALAVWRMTLDQSDAKAAFRQMDAMFDAMGGRKGTANELADRVLSLDAVTDPETVSKFLEKSWQARTAAAIAEYHQGAILSSARSQVANFMGNSLTILQSLTERAAAGTVSDVLDGETAIDLSEAAFMSFGLKEGVRDAMLYSWKMIASAARQGAGKVLRNPAEVERALEDRISAHAALMEMSGRKVETHTPRLTAENLGVDNVPVIGGVVDALGAVMRAPGALMGFQDDLFKLVNHRAELYAQAARRVISETREGLTPHDGAAARLAELVNSPTDDILDAARRAAEDRTFTAPAGPMTQTLMKLRRQLDSTVIPLPIGSMLMPFIQTPMNIAGYAFRRTPLAPLFKKYRDAIAQGGAEATLARTQMGLGTAAMLLAADYAQAGLITGAEPNDPAQREAWRRQGIQPYSIKVGDKYVSFRRLDPTGTVLAMGADMAQLFSDTPMEIARPDDDDGGVLEAASGAIGSVGHMLLDKTTMMNLMATNEYLNAPDRYKEAWAASQLGPLLVPNAVRDIERIQDPYVRDAQTVIDRVLARVPGASEKLPVKIDLWGDPMKQGSPFGPVYDTFLPISVTKEDQTPIDRELMRLNAKVSMPSKSITVDGVDVSLKNHPEIYNDLVRTAAQEVRIPRYYNLTMKEYLNALVSGELPESAIYDGKLDTYGVTRRRDDEKMDMISAVIRRYREKAMDQIKEKYASDLVMMADRKRQPLVAAQAGVTP